MLNYNYYIVQSTKSLIEQIKETIESLRVFINNDGGDLTFISFENEILTLKISGACIGCTFITNTFDEGVKQVLLTEYHNKIKDVKFIMGEKNA